MTIEDILNSIRAYYRDTSRPASETLEGLGILDDEIAGMIEALECDVTD